jgi:hypothetical protein
LVEVTPPDFGTIRVVMMCYLRHEDEDVSRVIDIALERTKVQTTPRLRCT